MNDHRKNNRYVRTESVNMAMNKICNDNKRVVCLNGPPGFGKTSASLQIMCEIEQRPDIVDGQTPLSFIIHTPEDLEKIISLNFPTVAFIDNFLGLTK